MKKITFFYEDIYMVGGAERVLSIIANELSKKYEVEVISLFKPVDKDKPVFEYFSGISILSILEEGRYKPLTHHWFEISKAVRKFLKNYQTDVFICATVRIIPFVRFYMKNNRFFMWEHSNSFAKFKLDLWQIGRFIGAKKADKVIVLSDRDKNNYIKKYHVKSSKVVRIYNPSDNNPLSSEYDINSKLIMSVSRIVEGKGYDLLIKVAKQVFSKHPDWKWRIYGDGNYKATLEKEIEANDLSNNVILMGYVKDVKERYKEHSIYVSCSKTEGFSMVYIEAHNAKLPIVSFNINCGPDEIITEGKNGYLIEPFDINEMTNKINYLIENPKVRKEMSDNTGFDKEKLNIEKITKEWIELIDGSIK